MKKIVYIGLFVIGLVFTSCQKQDFTPNSERSTDTPTWDCGFKSSDEGTTKPVNDPPIGNSIVDPNGEEEETDNK